jgi:hypothetical protein
VGRVAIPPSRDGAPGTLVVGEVVTLAEELAAELAVNVAPPAAALALADS